MQQTHATAETTPPEIVHANTGVAARSATLDDGAAASEVGSREDVTARLFKRMQHCVAPATPATWSRYIDSRLKQFCTR